MQIRNILLGLGLFFVAATPVAAHLRPEYAAQFQGLTEAQQKWVKTRHAKTSKLWCCDDADGYMPESADIDYDMKGGVYRVQLRGEWVPVEDDALLDDQPNIIGRAIVWVLPSFLSGRSAANSDTPILPSEFMARGSNPIRCFIPGSQG